MASSKLLSESFTPELKTSLIIFIASSKFIILHLTQFGILDASELVHLNSDYIITILKCKFHFSPPLLNNITIP